MTELPKSPVDAAFPHIQWDPLGSLRLTGQETSLLRMAETNPIDYTLADSRDASMYARVLLKLLSEAILASGGSGNEVARLNMKESMAEVEAIEILDRDPLGVVTHYAVYKLYRILERLSLSNSQNKTKTVSIASVFYTGKEGLLVDHWKALLRILNKGGKGDTYAQTAAATCLAMILCVACPSQRNKNKNVGSNANRTISYASAMEPLEALTAWIVTQLKSSSSSSSAGGSHSSSTNNNGVALVIPSMTTLMGCTETRILFASCGGIKYLCRHLRLKKKEKAGKELGPSSLQLASVQQLYELTFCLWTMTYELNNSADIRADFSKDGAAVNVLADLISVAPREKIVRVALSALRNLAISSAEISPGPAGAPTIEGSTYLNEMIASGCLKSIQNLQDRQWKDLDIIDDVQAMHKLLVDNYKEMTSWEVYKNEIELGNLQWGSTHTEAFFKENAKMFEGPDGDFRLLKILITLVSNSDDDVAAIACHDIGEFVRYYPNGRQIAKRLGAKELVMPLIEHDNVELQRHALQCVSKIMVQNWAYVGAN